MYSTPYVIFKCDHFLVNKIYLLMKKEFLMTEKETLIERAIILEVATVM